MSTNSSEEAAIQTVNDITCVIDGRPVPRADVLKWEVERMRVVRGKLATKSKTARSSKLNTKVVSTSPSAAEIAQMRNDLTSLKLELGSESIKDTLSMDLTLSGLTATLLVASSFGRYSISTTEISCPKGTAEGFSRWFTERVAANDVSAMLRACPDHYVLETQKDGKQYVLETTGGSPLATEFTIDFANTVGNPISLNPDLPIRLGGAALDNKKVIGFAYHQFGNLSGGGFRGQLSVAFPANTLWFMIDGHSWHLACEFSNWIEHYVSSGA